MPGRISKQRLRDGVDFYIFILPWLAGFLMLTFGPMIASFYYSFTEYNMFQPSYWVGWENYQLIFTDDPVFWTALYNTFYYVILSVPLNIIVGLFLAFLLNQKIRGVRWFRTAYYLPSIVPVVASSILWIWIFNPQYGLINGILAQFGLGGPAWLASPVWSKPALILMGLWGVGGGMVIYLAGLQGIPRHLYEAAMIDGATGWQQFWKITLPMLTPTIFFNLIMGIIGTFQTFTQPYIMTGGGPLQSTTFYVFYLFQMAFQNFRMGYASALAWILFLIITVFTLIQFKFANRWVYYESDPRR